jgi:hypothetical protein
MAHNATSSNNNYTNLNLSALTFLHPPNPPNHLNQCQCQVLPEQQQKKDQANNIRIYYNEPSSYTYNSNCYLIKESRYSSLDGWHAPSDDLVADDAAAGSAVVGVGWWGKSSKGDEGSKGNEGGEEVWEVSLFIPLFHMS